MFDKVKSMLGMRKPLNAMGYVRSHNLDDRPFTKALFLRAAFLIDSSAIEMDVQLPSYEGTHIMSFAETAVITVAFQITELGGKAIGQPVVYLPDDTVPSQFALVGAYSQYVAAILTSHLKGDGINCDFNRIGCEVAGQPFLIKPIDERVQYAMAALDTFKELVSANHPKVIEWHGMLAKLVPAYVLQWTTQDETLNNLDMSPMFGGLLRSLLKASN